jgi:hypothetical protein
MQCRICKETMIYANFSQHYERHKTVQKIDTNNDVNRGVNSGKYKKIDPMYLVTKQP